MPILEIPRRRSYGANAFAASDRSLRPSSSRSPMCGIRASPCKTVVVPTRLTNASRASHSSVVGQSSCAAFFLPAMSWPRQCAPNAQTLPRESVSALLRRRLLLRVQLASDGAGRRLNVVDRAVQIEQRGRESEPRLAGGDDGELGLRRNRFGKVGVGEHPGRELAAVVRPAHRSTPSVSALI